MVNESKSDKVEKTAEPFKSEPPLPFRNFILDAGTIVDRHPTDNLPPAAEKPHPGYGPHPIPQKKAKKVLAGFYEICSRGDYDREDLREYLEKRKNIQISDKELDQMDAVRKLVIDSFCGEKY